MPLEPKMALLLSWEFPQCGSSPSGWLIVHMTAYVQALRKGEAVLA